MCVFSVKKCNAYFRIQEELIVMNQRKYIDKAEGFFQAARRLCQPIFPYIITYLVMWILYLHAYSKNLINNEAAICLCMRTVLCVFLLYGIFMAYHKKLTMTHIIWLCILGGIVMRIGYCFYTPVGIRSHDMGAFSDTDVGHAAYIYNLYVHHTLPASYEYQFYQPPFYHLLAVLHMRLLSFFHPEAELYTLFEATKLVSCFASCSIVLLVYRICQKLTCSLEMTGLIVALTAFHPMFYLLGGSSNNDGVAIALMIFSLLMLIEWYQHRSLGYLTGLALGIGLGMMTKLNAAIVAFLAAPVMIFVFWQSIHEKTWVRQGIHYLIFLVLCSPLGLWYSIRNLIRFGQPLGFVHNIDAEAPTILYRGDYPLAQRFLPFTLKQLQQGIYTDTPNDYNIPLYVLRSSLFDEYSFSNCDTIARLLLYVNLLIILLSLLAMLVVILKGKKYSPALRFGCGAFWLLQIVSFLIFNLKYPDSCTMNFRYLVPTCLCGSIYLAAFWQQTRDYSRQGKQNGKQIFAKILTWLIPVCCGLFLLLSAGMYCNLS